MGYCPNRLDHPAILNILFFHEQFHFLVGTTNVRVQYTHELIRYVSRHILAVRMGANITFHLNANKLRSNRSLHVAPFSKWFYFTPRFFPSDWLMVKPLPSPDTSVFYSVEIHKLSQDVKAQSITATGRKMSKLNCGVPDVAQIASTSPSPLFEMSAKLYFQFEKSTPSTVQWFSTTSSTNIKNISISMKMKTNSS